MMMKKELASLTLAVVMCLSLCVPAFAYASEAADKEQVIEISKQMILRFIEQREAEYYDIKSVDFEIGESESSPDGLSFNINATIMHELKATSAEDLPYIQGMLSAIATEPASLALASAQENVFDVKVADVESYIGETTRMNLYFNVTVNMDGLSSLTEKDIQLYALDSSDNKVAITELNTPSYQEMFNQGYSNVETTLMEIREAGKILFWHEGQLQFRIMIHTIGLPHVITLMNGGVQAIPITIQHTVIGTAVAETAPTLSLSV